MNDDLVCSSLYQAHIAECGAKSECRENKKVERQTEREGFNSRFMYIFILKELKELARLKPINHAVTSRRSIFDITAQNDFLR